MYRKRTSHRAPPGQDNLFGWTIFLLLLTGFAAACWIGSFYIFGHPEKSFSYRVLRLVKKIDPPKRFELIDAPRGQFLDADKLHERFGSMPPRQLEAENDIFLRNYLRNYERTKDLVPYVTGSYNVMGTFRLGPNNFFTEGVVALARSTENPQVLLEMIFPAEPENAVHLERLLPTGLDIPLARTHDLTAVLNARVLPDGRLIITAVPLLYSNYTSTETTGTFSLEPPAGLNVGAGLPVLNAAAVEEAEKHYAGYLQRAGLPAHTPTLMRVQRSEAVDTSTIPVARAEPVDPTALPPTVTPDAAGTVDEMPVARAIPVTTTDEIPVARAVPVDQEDIPVARAEPVDPMPPVATEELQPFSEIVPTPEPTPTPAAAAWSVYDPGRMPRGRLLDLGGARNLAAQGNPTELTYLAGDFNVSASGPSRAVLRGRRGAQNMRVIVDFPPGSQPPAEGQTVNRDAARPFQITRVEEGPDGLVNVYVREVTRP